MEAGAASSSAAPPTQLSPQRAFWRARRRRRLERLPQSMAICGALFFCLAGLAEWGGFERYIGRTGGANPNRAIADLEWAFSAVTGGGSAWQQTSRRRLGHDPAYHDYAMTPYGNISVSSITCPVPPNASRIFPPLGFEDQEVAASVFMICVTLYMFLGLAIVCDSFFEAALSEICNAMNLKDDVAGATWMAAGGSAPELATSIIGVFISQSEVGIATIVGSAVFNVLFVIACCAFVAPNLKLTWWPLARDASYYCFSLAMLVIFISDDMQIAVWEAAILLLMYVGYVTIMYFNERLEVWVTARIAANEKPGNALQEMLKKIIENPIFAVFLYGAILVNAVVVILEIDEFNRKSFELPCKCGVYIGAAKLPVTLLSYVNLAFNIFFISEMLIKFYAYGFFGYWKIPLNCFDGSLVFLIIIELVLTAAARSEGQRSADPTQDANDGIGVGVARMFRLLKFVRFVRTLRVLRLSRGLAKTAPQGEEGAIASSDEEGGKQRTVTDSNGELKAEKETPTEEATEDDEEEDDDEPFNPFEVWGDMSSVGGMFGRFFWFVGLPLSLVFWLTIPDCRREIFKKFWLLTFFGCIFWIGLLSCVMVWMMERFGLLVGIGDEVMGIFILAAGTSIPDCLSSIAVARRGHGDMAVSSSIGSNIFDVLIGLPVPWFIYTAILRPALGPSYGPQWVQVASDALAVMILLLFVMVALVITTVHLSGWILSIKLGLAMMGLYFIFLIMTLLLVEEVVFPPCKIFTPEIGG